jgi:hypothetical protein
MIVPGTLAFNHGLVKLSLAVNFHPDDGKWMVTWLWFVLPAPRDRVGRIHVLKSGILNTAGLGLTVIPPT